MNNESTNKTQNIDIDDYISGICSILDNEINEYDKFAVKADLKKYVYDEASLVSKKSSIKISEAVNIVLNDMGTPEEFAKVFIKELFDEKRYLLGKVLIAFFIAGFPFLMIFIILLGG